MSSPVVSCQLEEPVETVAQVMGENQIRRIPIFDQNGCRVGIISQADLLSRVTVIEPVISVLRQISTPHSKSQKEPAESADVDKAPAAKEKAVEE